MNNLTKTLKKQGVSKNTAHEGIVVDNEDPDQLGRIRVRIKELNQNIEDKHLPWCIPKFAHVDGAKGGDDFDRSGTFFVPKKKTKVLVEFQDGDPHFPIWRGYTVDEKTKLKETNKNYPNRAIVRFSNGMFILVDTKTNEVFIHNPGDTHLIVQGDMEQHVFGNVQETCHDSQSKAIDNYFLNDKDLPIKEAKQSQQKKTNFKGLGKKSGSGNRHVHVKGDYTLKIEGDRITEITGNDTTKVRGNKTTEVQGNMSVKVKGQYSLDVSGTATMKAGGILTLKGSLIKIN